MVEQHVVLEVPTHRRPELIRKSRAFYAALSRWCEQEGTVELTAIKLNPKTSQVYIAAAVEARDKATAMWMLRCHMRRAIRSYNYWPYDREPVKEYINDEALCSSL